MDKLDILLYAAVIGIGFTMVAIAAYLLWMVCL
jgi:hypothetical protein